MTENRPTAINITMTARDLLALQYRHCRGAPTKTRPLSACTADVCAFRRGIDRWVPKLRSQNTCRRIDQNNRRAARAITLADDERRRHMRSSSMPTPVSADPHPLPARARRGRQTRCQRRSVPLHHRASQFAARRFAHDALSAQHIGAAFARRCSRARQFAIGTRIVAGRTVARAVSIPAN